MSLKERIDELNLKYNPEFNFYSGDVCSIGVSFVDEETGRLYEVERGSNNNPEVLEQMAISNLDGRGAILVKTNFLDGRFSVSLQGENVSNPDMQNPSMTKQHKERYDSVVSHLKDTIYLFFIYTEDKQ